MNIGHDVAGTSADNDFQPPGSMRSPPSRDRTYLCPCRLWASTIGMPPHLTLDKLEDHLFNHGMAPAQLVCDFVPRIVFIN